MTRDDCLARAEYLLAEADRTLHGTGFPVVTQARVAALMDLARAYQRQADLMLPGARS